MYENDEDNENDEDTEDLPGIEDICDTGGLISAYEDRCAEIVRLRKQVRELEAKLALLNANQQG